MYYNDNSTALVELHEKNQLGLLNKKRKTRWDENTRPYIKYLSRRSRWGTEHEKTFIPLPFTHIPENLDKDAFEILIRKCRYEDILKRLSCNDWENVDPDLRSPSPEPMYDKNGVRINTREIRTKEQYVKEKNAIIEDLIKIDDTYVPPADYRPPKKTKKLFIPEVENYNFIGLILGPKGSTQRDLEKKSGCKISIRGKGSNWNKTYDRSNLDENEPLHVYLQADTEEELRMGISLVEPILDVHSHEHKMHKKNQLAKIEQIYGLVKEQGCENCGEKGHSAWACPLKMGFGKKFEIKCSICGDKSHPTGDCPEKKASKEVVENEVFKFMKELSDPKNDVLALDKERDAGDIRNSIIWTGRYEKKEEELKEETKVEEDKKEEPNQSNDKTDEVKKTEENKGENAPEKETEDQENENEKEEGLDIKIDPTIPTNPLFNPNQRKVMPINPNPIPVPESNLYYNTFNNPYVFQNPAFNAMSNRPPLYNPNIQHPLHRYLPLNNLPGLSMMPGMAGIQQTQQYPYVMKTMQNQVIMPPTMINMQAYQINGNQNGDRKQMPVLIPNSVFPQNIAGVPPGFPQMQPGIQNTYIRNITPPGNFNMPQPPNQNVRPRPPNPDVDDITIEKK